MVIRTGSESSGNTSYLLDMTPETTSWTDPALTAGATFSDPDAGVAITPVSVGTTGALVSVTFTGLPCYRANPTVTLSSTETAGVAPGTPITYAVSVTSNDGAGCSPSDFSLSAQAPSGWITTLGLPELQVAPGASGSTTLEAISASTADAGSYVIEVTATSSTDPSIGGTASAEYLVTVAVPLSVQVSADQTRKRRVRIYVAASLGQSAAGGGARVALTITRPDGTRVEASLVADDDGVADYALRVGPKDPVGTYDVAAVVSFEGESGVAETSFKVN